MELEKKLKSNLFVFCKCILRKEGLVGKSVLLFLKFSLKFKEVQCKLCMDSKCFFTVDFYMQQLGFFHS